MSAKADCAKSSTFGHTIGHALEAETRYTQLLHGEAVAWGMIAATHIALSTGKLDSVTAGRISNSILGFGRLPRMELKTANILKRLRSDKKTRREWCTLFAARNWQSRDRKRRAGSDHPLGHR